MPKYFRFSAMGLARVREVVVLLAPARAGEFSVSGGAVVLRGIPPKPPAAQSQTVELLEPEADLPPVAAGPVEHVDGDEPREDSGSAGHADVPEDVSDASGHRSDQRQRRMIDVLATAGVAFGVCMALIDVRRDHTTLETLVPTGIAVVCVLVAAAMLRPATGSFKKAVRLVAVVAFVVLLIACVLGLGNVGETHGSSKPKKVVRRVDSDALSVEGAFSPPSRPIAESVSGGYAAVLTSDQEMVVYDTSAFASPVASVTVPADAQTVAIWQRTIVVAGAGRSWTYRLTGGGLSGEGSETYGTSPGGVEITAAGVWMANPAKAKVQHYSLDGVTASTLSAPGVVGTMAPFGAGVIVAAHDTIDNVWYMQRFDASGQTGDTTSYRYAIDANPQSMLLAFGHLWVAFEYKIEVFNYTASSGFGLAGSFPTTPGSHVLAADAENLLVANQSANLLQRINPHTEKVTGALSVKDPTGVVDLGPTWLLVASDRDLLPVTDNWTGTDLAGVAMIDSGDGRHDLSLGSVSR